MPDRHQTPPGHGIATLTWNVDVTVVSERRERTDTIDANSVPANAK